MGLYGSLGGGSGRGDGLGVGVGDGLGVGCGATTGGSRTGQFVSSGHRALICCIVKTVPVNCAINSIALRIACVHAAEAPPQHACLREKAIDDETLAGIEGLSPYGSRRIDGLLDA